MEHVWASLYLAVALAYIIYLIAHFYFRNKSEHGQKNAVHPSPSSEQNLNPLSNSSTASNLVGQAADASANATSTTNAAAFGADSSNLSINSRLEQINKSINILEEKILKSGKVKKKSFNGTGAEPTTGLDYLRKGLRNRKKQIPKHEKDIKFEQMDKERRQAKQLAEKKNMVDSLKAGGSKASGMNICANDDYHSVSTSMSSLSTATSSNGSGSKVTPGTETTSVDSYTDAEKANLAELQCILKQVTELRGAADSYQKRSKW